MRAPLRTLISGQALGQAGDGLAQIAFAQVVLFEVGRGATPWELAKLLAATLVPYSLAGPVAGVAIDRWDRRRVLVAVSLARAALVAAAPAVLVVGSQPLAYAGVLLLVSSSRFVLAAKGAAIPHLSAPDRLVRANAASSMAGLTAAFAGAVGGSLFVARAPAAGFLLAAAGYAAAATRFRTLPAIGGGGAARGLRSVVSDVAFELRTFARTAEVRRPLVAVWAHRTLLGAGFVLLVLVADRRYRLETTGYALALAVTGVGAFAGTLATPAIVRRLRPDAIVRTAFLLAALAAAAGAIRPEIGPLTGGLGVAAFAFQVLKVHADARVQAAAPDVVRGRVFSLYDVGYNVAFVVAGLALVPLWRPGREQPLLWLIAAAFAVAGTVRGPRGLSLLAGALPVLAFPEANLWPLGAAGLVPLLRLVRASPSGREAAMRAWLGGAGFLVAMHHWLLPTVTVFVPLLALGFGLLWVPWGLIAWRLRDRAALCLLFVPAAFVAAEYARSWHALGGPWGVLGTSLWSQPRLIGLASFGGAWALSFVLVAINVALASRRMAAAIAAGALLAVPAVNGPDTGALRVAIVQPGIVRGPVARLDAHLRASRGLDAELVVWGESSAGFDPDDRPDLVARIVEAAADADILVNVDARRGRGGIFKTSLLVTPDGPDGRYDKMRLVPFGEYVPLRGVFGVLTRVTRAADEDRRRGDRLVVLEAAGRRIGPLVCFESAFGDMARTLARMGADVLVVQSATTTFQGSWAQAQHASLAALRAVESGRPVVHATPSDTSAAFDASGRKLAWLPSSHRGTVVVDVPLRSGVTPYARTGDIVPLAAVALTVLAVILSATRRRPFSAALPSGGGGPRPPRRARSRPR